MEISEVENAIKCLDINKTDGMDGVYAEHLKHCDKRIVPLLAMCITGFFVHGILPSSLLYVVLVLIIKDKCSKINSKDNYRPIALASIVSKNVENLLLDRMSVMRSTMSNQFGYDKKHGTDLCIYVLKEVIDRHTSVNSILNYKAFDRVKHSILFQKLIDRGVP